MRAPRNRAIALSCIASRRAATGQPVEIAALVALLLSGEGGFFCGSVLYVDGGTDALLRPADWPKGWDIPPAAFGAVMNSGIGCMRGALR